VEWSIGDTSHDLKFMAKLLPFSTWNLDGLDGQPGWLHDALWPYAGMEHDDIGRSTP
jgi:hypothetical protein